MVNSHLKRLPKIGIITPFWPPLHGGAERYEYRLAKNLCEQSFQVKVFTGTKELEGYDNGEINVERFTPYGNYEYSPDIKLPVFERKLIEFKNRINHYAFLEAATEWLKKNNFDIIIVGNALQIFGALFARELFAVAKALGIPIGIIHHDLSGVVEQVIFEHYKTEKGWSCVQKNTIEAIKMLTRDTSDLEALYTIRSPLFFRPDFVICNSMWTSSFIDPFDKIPKFIFHPMTTTIDKHQLETNITKDFDVLMINPQNRKNPSAMRSLIEERPNLKYCILKGGWGNSFETFLPMIKNLPAFNSGNVRLIDYVSNISDIYRASKVMFFPSTAEGYGMAAVEPMYFGLPVLSSNYPAIIEGVGDAALALCPYSSTGDDWGAALDLIFKQYEAWKARSEQRANFLKEREKIETIELCSFLMSFS